MTNGQELQQEDVNALGELGGLADDRVLWELVRLLPGTSTPQKVILPFGESDAKKLSGLTSTALVQGNTADAKVRVMPFRALIGSTTLAASSVVENLRGQRSGYHLGASTIYGQLTINANAAGNPRWTLIYAAVTPNANGDSDSRYIKDPTSGAVSASSVVVNKKTTVVLGQVDGAAAASPTRPALPADAAGVYNIALAYIWVPNGFGGASTVLRSAIYEVAPCVPIGAAMGVTPARPATSLNKVGAAVDVNQSGSSNALRPGAYLPSTMMGGEKITILLQRGLSPLSHADGDVIDDSIDWRFRYFNWRIHARSGNTAAAGFASDRAATGTTPAGTASLSTQGTHYYSGAGQSFVDDNANTIAYGTSNGTAMYVTSAQVSQLTASSIAIHVRNTDGALVLKLSGTDTFQAIITLEASGPYSNYGTV